LLTERKQLQSRLLLADESFRSGAPARFRHAAFVLRAGTRPWQGDFPERQVRGRRLCAHKLTPDAMHGGPADGFVEGGKQGGWSVALLSQEVKSPGAVFA
jgi:hypothetical protein